MRRFEIVSKTVLSQTLKRIPAGLLLGDSSSFVQIFLFSRWRKISNILPSSHKWDNGPVRQSRFSLYINLTVALFEFLGQFNIVWS